MSKQKRRKSMLVLTIFMAFVAMAVFVPGLTKAGDLEPTAPPGSTMKTLDEIPPSWSQTLSASDRFELVLNDEAVLDKETGLVWARNANILNGTKSWEEAVVICRSMGIGKRMGWRLPTVEELASLADYSQSDPPLPPGYSSFFDNVQSGGYWTSTTYESGTLFAWYVRMEASIYISGFTKASGHYVWPVRGGSGPILVPHTP